MDEQTYAHYKEIIEGGQIAQIGDLTASTLAELDYLREVGIVKPDPQDTIAQLTDEIAGLISDKDALTTDKADLQTQLTAAQKQNADLQKQIVDLQKATKVVVAPPATPAADPVKAGDAA